MSTNTDTTAVIIGGSITGSLNAAVLSPHFSRVVILERDQLPQAAEPHEGVPHSHQVHALTVGGREAIEQIFPGWTATAESEGAPVVDTGKDLKYASKAGWLPRFPSQMRSILASRVYIEDLIRRHAKQIENIEWREGVDVEGLILEGDRVVGVRTSAGDVRGDLVLDASGRTSGAPEWLTEIGYEAPEETQINARWGYSTMYFSVPEGWDPGFAALFIAPTVVGDGPEATRGGAMWRQEGGIWGLTGQGCAADFPPSKVGQLREYFESFDAKDFVELMDIGQEALPLKVWRHAANRLRDFGALERRPEAFVVLGDSVAAFNPIYGMGMAVAARGALIMKGLLEEWSARPEGADYGLGFADLAQKRLEPLVQGAWSLSTGADLKIPGVRVNGEEQPAAESTPQGEFFDRVLALATEDEEIALKFIETRQLVRGPEWMADSALAERIKGDWDRLGAMKRETMA